MRSECPPCPPCPPARWPAVLAGLLLAGICSHLVGAAGLVAVPPLGLRVATGFQVTLFADANLADDIYAMTLDARGDVVVTGRGYIRTLLDDNDDGVADRAVDYATSPSGGMGMCFDGGDLLFVGDGALWRFQDIDRDGQADDAPQRLLSLQGGEHGGHALRQGPEGAWYVLGGNDAKVGAVALALENLPPGTVEGGGLFRLGEAGQANRLVAHGFRNPYDFDFNAYGDLFTYDSDVERDFFLPWYLPTRIYHIAPAGHHGWRLEGHMRSWPRPGRSVDTVAALAEIGRGSPTGVACYRHRQFPEYYHDGLFALDWTFGRLYFLPLEPAGSTYRGEPEVFLESVGTQGFAPTDIVVAPDGSLFVSTGGRHTRGAVYRIQYMAERGRRLLAADWRLAAGSLVELVLTAPQPLEAWSRAIWKPEAVLLGAEVFETVAMDDRVLPEQRIRALEVLTEVHEGLTPAVALACAQSGSPQLRARVAWAIGAVPLENPGPVLLGLARDNSPAVRCAALESMRRWQSRLDLVTRQQALAANLAHPDKRVRQAAARLAAGLPPSAWLALWRQQEQSGLPQARLTTALAVLWRDGISAVHTGAVASALAVLNQDRGADLREQALRLIQLGLGDYHLDNPSVEVFTAYEPALSLAGHGSLTKTLEKALVTLLPSGAAQVDQEAARLLAFIESADPAVPAKILAQCTARSPAAADFHYLIVFSRLRSPAVTNFTTQVARALVGLDRKLDVPATRPRGAWSERLGEVTRVLLRNDPRLGDALLREPDFARPAHLPLVPLLGSARYAACARIFYQAAQRAPGFAWSEPLVDLLSALPPEEVHPLFRRQLDNISLRDRLLVELAPKPIPSDRDKFILGLSSPRPEVVRASMSALLQFPNDPTPGTAVGVLRLLRRLLKEPGAQTARSQALALLTRLSGQKFNVIERGADLTVVYEPVFAWFENRFPGLSRQLDADDHETRAQWEALLRAAPWARGDAGRGQELYAARGCQACHEGAGALGPELAGSAQRLSAADLMRAILFPSRDVAGPYRTTTFRTRDGQVHTGLVAFESPDGVILRTGQNQTVRLAEAEITGRETSSVSFMPSGLLAGFKPGDLADLYAYLRTLQPMK